MGTFPTIIILCLYCTLSNVLAGTVPRPSDIEDGFFRGRSGNMILKPVGYKKPDISMILLDQAGGSLLQNKNDVAEHYKKQISIYNIADLIGRSLGISPIHHDFASHNFIQTKFFERPMANLLIELDSVGDHVLTDPSINIDLKYLKALRHGELDSFPLSVMGTSYPDSSTTLTTSIISGQKPSQHGIVAKQWKSLGGKNVHAYASNDPSTWSQVANLPDLIYQTFRGKSLIFSLSGDEQSAKANSVNPTLAGEHPTWTNDYTIHFRPVEKDFIVTSQGSNPGIRRAFEDLTADKLKNMFAKGNNVLNWLKDHKNVQTKYREGFVSLKYLTNDRNTQYVRYDLTLPEDMMLFSELQAAHLLLQVLKSPVPLSFVQDDSPDFYTLSFNSLTPLIEKYGRHSPQVIGGLHLLDNTIPLIIKGFSQLYPKRLLSEVILLGSHPSSLSVNNPDKRPLLSMLNRLLPSKNFFEAGLFPSIYIDGTEEKQSNEEYCKMLDRQLKQEETGFKAYCLPSRQKLTSMSQKIPLFLSQSVTTYAKASSDVVTYNDVAKYQIVLWISLLMLFTTIYVVYSLAFMNFKKDTLIYSTFNPKWENRAARGN